MKNVFIYLFILLPIFLFAQRPNFSGGDFRKGNASQHIGVVSGKLVDAEDGSSLPFANVRMFRFNDVLLEGTITDEEGFFEFNKLALANGYLLINYIGYEEKRVEISLVFIPRNHLVDEAIEKAINGNIEPYKNLLEILSKPYQYRNGLDKFLSPPTQKFEECFQTYCGT